MSNDVSQVGFLNISIGFDTCNAMPLNSYKNKKEKAHFENIKFTKYAFPLAIMVTGG